MKIAKDIATLVKGITEKRNMIAAAGCAVVDADKQSISVTDMDIYGTITGLPIKGAGKHLVDAHALARICAATKKTLGLEVGKDGLAVVSDGDTYMLGYQGEADGFPVLMLGNGSTAGVKGMPMPMLNVVFCASTEETRYYLHGVHLRQKDGILQAVATDGHRLAIRSSNTAVTGMLDANVIIPTKTVVAMQALYDTAADIEFIGAKIRVTNGNITLVSKLIDGNFPDVDRVIPSVDNQVIKADIDIKSLLTVTSKRAVIGTKTIKIEFADVGFRAILVGDKSSMAKELAKGKYPAMVVGANISYLDDIIKDIGGGVLHMCITDPNAPLRIQGNDANSSYILMPVRV